jgi:hypothetical protein
MQAIRQEFLEKENRLMGLVDSQLFMEEKEIKVAKSYLEEFFATMENDKQFEYQILMKCRR